MEKVAIVTGGAVGIGYSICEDLAFENYKVALLDVNKEAGREAENKLNKNSSLKFYECDVTLKDDIRGVISKIEAELGEPAILVNNAGIVRDNYLLKITEEDWDKVIDTNLKSAFLMSQAVLPYMTKGSWGRIVNISSRSWLGNPGQANYSASKGGLISLTRTLALELAQFGITVNAVSPALIDTPLTKALPENVRERLIEAQPTKRMGRPEEVSAAVMFFVSQRASFITGQVLHVCGGKSVGIGM